MAFSKSPHSFADIKLLFEQALESERGIKITCSSRGAAMLLRSRFNYYRKMDRGENKKTYSEDHPMHGWSIYDGLVLVIPPKGSDEQHVLYIKPRLVENVEVEEIIHQTAK